METDGSSEGSSDDEHEEVGDDAEGNRADAEYLQRQMSIKTELDQLGVLLKQKQEMFKIEAHGVDLHSYVGWARLVGGGGVTACSL
jgi:hypothetical protein